MTNGSSSSAAVVDGNCKKPDDVVAQEGDSAAVLTGGGAAAAAAVPLPEMSETTASSSPQCCSEAATSNKLVDFFESPQHQTLVLSNLARQLEYYFSVQNLGKDTYLRTLRDLNDGCVPVCILANFGKVRSIVISTKCTSDDEVRIHSVLQAATQYSDLLIVKSIDKATGKVATDDTPSSASTILAVGPVQNEPLELSYETTKRTLSVTSLPSLSMLALNAKSPTSPTSPTSPPLSPVSPSTTAPSNTVIFRELAPDVTEEEVRRLFDFEGCPKIQNIYADVAYCWFVTLNTDSREDMMRVMMQVRTQTLRDEYVQARLKASSISIPDTAPPPMMPYWPGADGTSAVPNQSAGPAKRKQKRKSGRNRNKKNNNNSNRKNNNNNNNNNNSDKKINSPKNEKQRKKVQEETKAPQPPSLGEEDFPSFQQEKKVEWGTIPPVGEVQGKDQDGEDEFEEGDGDMTGKPSSIKSVSDVASTVTISSSSTDSVGGGSSSNNSKKTTLGGYAAALLMNPSPRVGAMSSSNKTAPKAVVDSNSSIVDERTADGDNSNRADETKETADATTNTAIVVKPPTWGRGRSFADILRTS